MSLCIRVAGGTPVRLFQSCPRMPIKIGTIHHAGRRKNGICSEHRHFARSANFYTHKNIAMKVFNELFDLLLQPVIALLSKKRIGTKYQEIKLKLFLK